MSDAPVALTIPERRAVAIVTVLVAQWPHDHDRDTLLALLGEVQPQIRRYLAMDDLAQAARGLIHAKGGADWSVAIHAATRALVRVARAEIIETFAAERGAARQAG